MSNDPLEALDAELDTSFDSARDALATAAEAAGNAAAAAEDDDWETHDQHIRAVVEAQDRFWGRDVTIEQIAD